MNIFTWIIIIIGGLAGILSTGYLVIALPVTIVAKFVRKAKYGEKIF